MGAVRGSRRSQVTSTTALYVVLIVAAVLFLVPFFLILRNALSTDQDLAARDFTWLPPSINTDNFSALFDNRAIPFGEALRNSVLISVLQTAGAVLVASMAGYGLARIPYRYANAVFAAILATLMIPAAVTFVPTYLIVTEIGWVNTYRGLIVPGLFQAFAAFLFRQYFVGFPLELEEASRIDGLSTWGTFWRIVVPNSKGIFAAVGSITFIASWNAFLWPLVVGKNRPTVQVALSSFLNAQSPRMTQLFAASLIAIVPLLLVFVALQRFIVEGVERTGING